VDPLSLHGHVGGIVHLAVQRGLQELGASGVVVQV